MRHTITGFEFGQLKTFFDQNDLNGGACFLNQLLEQWQEDLYKKDYAGETLFHLPFECGDGIELEYNENNTLNKPTLRIDHEIFEQINVRLLHELCDRIKFLEDMHSEDDKSLKHIPKIISTKEQYEEMKPHMEKEDRVLVHTTFDKALNVL